MTINSATPCKTLSLCCKATNAKVALRKRVRFSSSSHRDVHCFYRRESILKTARLNVLLTLSQCFPQAGEGECEPRRVIFSILIRGHALRRLVTPLREHIILYIALSPDSDSSFRDVNTRLHLASINNARPSITTEQTRHSRIPSAL